MIWLSWFSGFAAGIVMTFAYHRGDIRMRRIGPPTGAPDAAAERLRQTS